VKKKAVRFAALFAVAALIFCAAAFQVYGVLGVENENGVEYYTPGMETATEQQTEAPGRLENLQNLGERAVEFVRNISWQAVSAVLALIPAVVVGAVYLVKGIKKSKNAADE